MDSAFNHMQAVYQLLQQDSAVNALVGTKIYPYQRPQKDGFPAIVYSKLSERYVKSKDAAIPDGHQFTLEIYADRNDTQGGYVKAQNIAQACQNKLRFFRGVVGDYTYLITHENESDADYEEAPEAFKVIQDYKLTVL